MKRETLEKKSLKELYGIFWKYFSIYIRNSEENCFTCGKYVDPKEANAGHYEHEGVSDNWLLKSDPRNIHKQCVHCNKYLNGNLNAYAVRLEAKYGHGILQELQGLKYIQYIPEKIEVIEKIEKYKKLVKNT